MNSSPSQRSQSDLYSVGNSKDNPILLNNLRPQTTEQQLKKIKDQVESDHNRISQQNQRPFSPESKQSQMFNLNQIETDRLFKIRRSFQQALNKLSTNDTKEVGVNECKRIIEANCDQASLRVYLSLLCEKHKNSTTSNKELQVLLFGHLAKVYKSEMLDPLDRPPNLLKTIVRVCETIHSFLKENSTLIHLACANSLVEILDNCFDQKEDKLSLSLIFYEPLASVINGGYDKMGQLAASVCILKLLEYLIEKGHNGFFDFLCPKFIQLFIVYYQDNLQILQQSKCDHPDFLQCLGTIISQTSLKYLTQYIWEIVQRCIKIVQNPDTQSYLKKIEACNLLKTIAIQLKDVADLIFGYMHRQVIHALEVAQGDRVLKVRQGAIQAKQQWQQVKFINKEIEEKKKNEELHGLNPDEIIQARTGYANMDDVRKQVLQEAQDDIDNKDKPRPRTAGSQARQGQPSKFKMLRELARLNQELRVQKPYSPTSQERKLLALEQNWSAAQRANQFLKRGVGTGGGHIPGESNERKVGKLNTHNLQRQSIRDLIIQSMKNKNITFKDLEEYAQGDAQLYDILKKHYNEEAQQFSEGIEPEMDGIASRVLNNRQKLALRQDIGKHKKDDDKFKDAFLSTGGDEFERDPSGVLGGAGSGIGGRHPEFGKTQKKGYFEEFQNDQNKNSKDNNIIEDDDFFGEEQKVGAGDQKMPDFERNHDSNQRVKFQKEPTRFQYPNQSNGTGTGNDTYNPFQNQSSNELSGADNTGQNNGNPKIRNQRGSTLSGIDGGSVPDQSLSRIQSINDPVIEELLGDRSHLGQQNSNSNKLNPAQQQLQQTLSQGKSISDMDQKEIQKLSKQIIKQALNEDYSDIHSQNNSQYDQDNDQMNPRSQNQQTRQTPSFAQRNQQNQRDQNGNPSQFRQDTFVPGSNQEDFNNQDVNLNSMRDIKNKVKNPFKSQQNGNNLNTGSDDFMFEEQQVYGGDQSINPGFGDQQDSKGAASRQNNSRQNQNTNDQATRQPNQKVQIAQMLDQLDQINPNSVSQSMANLMQNFDPSQPINASQNLQGGRSTEEILRDPAILAQVDPFKTQTLAKEINSAFLDGQSDQKIEEQLGNMKPEQRQLYQILKQDPNLSNQQKNEIFKQLSNSGSISPSIQTKLQQEAPQLFSKVKQIQQQMEDSINQSQQVKQNIVSKNEGNQQIIDQIEAKQNQTFKLPQTPENRQLVQNIQQAFLDNQSDKAIELQLESMQPEQRQLYQALKDDPILTNQEKNEIFQQLTLEGQLQPEIAQKIKRNPQLQKKMKQIKQISSNNPSSQVLDVFTNDQARQLFEKQLMKMMPEQQKLYQILKSDPTMSQDEKNEIFKQIAVQGKLDQVNKQKLMKINPELSNQLTDLETKISKKNQIQDNPVANLLDQFSEMQQAQVVKQIKSQVNQNRGGSSSQDQSELLNQNSSVQNQQRFKGGQNKAEQAQQQRQIIEQQIQSFPPEQKQLFEILSKDPSLTQETKNEIFKQIASTGRLDSNLRQKLDQNPQLQQKVQNLQGRIQNQISKSNPAMQVLEQIYGPDNELSKGSLDVFTNRQSQQAIEQSLNNLLPEQKQVYEALKNDFTLGQDEKNEIFRQIAVDGKLDLVTKQRLAAKNPELKQKLENLQQRIIQTTQSNPMAKVLSQIDKLDEGQQQQQQQQFQQYQQQQQKELLFQNNALPPYLREQQAQEVRQVIEAQMSLLPTEQKQLFETLNQDPTLSQDTKNEIFKQISTTGQLDQNMKQKLNQNPQLQQKVQNLQEKIQSKVKSANPALQVLEQIFGPNAQLSKDPLDLFTNVKAQLNLEKNLNNLLPEQKQLYQALKDDYSLSQEEKNEIFKQIAVEGKLDPQIRQVLSNKNPQLQQQIEYLQDRIIQRSPIAQMLNQIQNLEEQNQSMVTAADNNSMQAREKKAKIVQQAIQSQLNELPYEQRQLFEALSSEPSISQEIKNEIFKQIASTGRLDQNLKQKLSSNPQLKQKVENLQNRIKDQIQSTDPVQQVLEQIYGSDGQLSKGSVDIFSNQKAQQIVEQNLQNLLPEQRQLYETLKNDFTLTQNEKNEIFRQIAVEGKLDQKTNQMIASKNPELQQKMQYLQDRINQKTQRESNGVAQIMNQIEKIEEEQDSLNKFVSPQKKSQQAQEVKQVIQQALFKLPPEQRQLFEALNQDPNLSQETKNEIFKQISTQGTIDQNLQQQLNKSPILKQKVRAIANQIQDQILEQNPGLAALQQICGNGQRLSQGQVDIFTNKQAQQALESQISQLLPEQKQLYDTLKNDRSIDPETKNELFRQIMTDGKLDKQLQQQVSLDNPVLKSKIEQLSERIQQKTQSQALNQILDKIADISDNTQQSSNPSVKALQKILGPAAELSHGNFEIFGNKAQQQIIEQNLDKLPPAQRKIYEILKQDPNLSQQEKNEIFRQSAVEGVLDRNSERLLTQNNPYIRGKLEDIKQELADQNLALVQSNPAENILKQICGGSNSEIKKGEVDIFSTRQSQSQFERNLPNLLPEQQKLYQILITNQALSPQDKNEIFRQIALEGQLDQGLANKVNRINPELGQQLETLQDKIEAKTQSRRKRQMRSNQGKMSQQNKQKQAQITKQVIEQQLQNLPLEHRQLFQALQLDNSLPQETKNEIFQQIATRGKLDGNLEQQLNLNPLLKNKVKNLVSKIKDQITASNPALSVLEDIYGSTSELGKGEVDIFTNKLAQQQMEGNVGNLLPEQKQLYEILKRDSTIPPEDKNEIFRQLAVDGKLDQSTQRKLMSANPIVSNQIQNLQNKIEQRAQRNPANQLFKEIEQMQQVQDVNDESPIDQFNEDQKAQIVREAIDNQLQKLSPEQQQLFEALDLDPTLPQETKNEIFKQIATTGKLDQVMEKQLNSNPRLKQKVKNLQGKISNQLIQSNPAVKLLQTIDGPNDKLQGEAPNIFSDNQAQQAIETRLHTLMPEQRQLYEALKQDLTLSPVEKNEIFRQVALKGSLDSFNKRKLSSNPLLQQKLKNIQDQIAQKLEQVNPGLSIAKKLDQLENQLADANQSKAELTQAEVASEVQNVFSNPLANQILESQLQSLLPEQKQLYDVLKKDQSLTPEVKEKLFAQIAQGKLLDIQTQRALNQVPHLKQKLDVLKDQIQNKLARIDNPVQKLFEAASEGLPGEILKQDQVKIVQNAFTSNAPDAIKDQQLLSLPPEQQQLYQVLKQDPTLSNEEKQQIFEQLSIDGQLDSRNIQKLNQNPVLRQKVQQIEKKIKDKIKEKDEMLMKIAPLVAMIKKQEKLNQSMPDNIAKLYEQLGLEKNSLNDPSKKLQNSMLSQNNPYDSQIELGQFNNQNQPYQQDFFDDMSAYPNQMLGLNSTPQYSGIPIQSNQLGQQYHPYNQNQSGINQTLPQQSNMSNQKILGELQHPKFDENGNLLYPSIISGVQNPGLDNQVPVLDQFGNVQYYVPNPNSKMINQNTGQNIPSMAQRNQNQNLGTFGSLNRFNKNVPQQQMLNQSASQNLPPLQNQRYSGARVIPNASIPYQNSKNQSLNDQSNLGYQNQGLISPNSQARLQHLQSQGLQPTNQAGQNNTYNQMGYQAQNYQQQQSNDNNWPYDVLSQLKNVEYFMQNSFNHLDSRLSNINHKIVNTKQNISKAKMVQQPSKQTKRFK
ncbi:UNKNOWN [Stylonychia lemnae]|uniref:Uncharacterized protein n=1 Tax=Stylonychia lemnae TaxID=5949 RepID=A0A077ZPN2_STYLE|nr:UNKNOWN [Stylonychia lemnae]|eukprot:CDW71424.1 UNKNOWN [Stylonychia lemnae]